jgi:hypothetical protein
LEGQSEGLDDALKPLTSSQYCVYAMKHIIWTLRYISVILVVGVPLAIPIIIFRGHHELNDEQSIEHRQYRQLIFYLFAWFLTIWLGFWVSDAFALALPYIFGFVAR